MSEGKGPSRVSLAEGRFARFERIAWWDQARLRSAKVLVVGAGALGNEVVKNLSLLGIGHLLIADKDRVERTNLARSVLFRATDEGRPKAEVAARAARDLYPDVCAEVLVGDVLADVGLGRFRWADVIVGAVDNREARVFINESCAAVGRAWIDGGIEVLNGVVRVFAPPETACYECTMSEADWDQLNQRRSCSLLARQAHADGGTPTTPTTASVIGALQAQEVVKRLHGLEDLAGRGFVLEGLGHSSYVVRYPVKPDCPWHAPPAEVETTEFSYAETPLREIWEYGRRRLGGLDAIDLSRELVGHLKCSQCGYARGVFLPIPRVTEEQATCPACGEECGADLFHSLSENSGLLDRSAEQLGLPARDVMWLRFGDEIRGVELGG